MSDRPTGANGKRSQTWGTRDACPVCGQCLCFGCHPLGPCVDEHGLAVRSGEAGDSPFASGGWTLDSPTGLGVAGLQLRAGTGSGPLS